MKKANPFSRFGIDHLSASSLNLWIANPGIWALQYLAGLKSEAKPVFWRGNAVETAGTFLLRGRSTQEAYEAALQTYDANAHEKAFDRLTKDEAFREESDKERDTLFGYVQQFEAAMKERLTAPRDLVATQLKITTFLEGVPVEIIGWLDYAFSDGLVLDCKSTGAMPSKAKPDHSRQVALYSRARDKAKVGLIYATPKKGAVHMLDALDVQASIEQLTIAGQSLASYLGAMKTRRQAVLSAPINVDDFRYSPEAGALLEQVARDNSKL